VALETRDALAMTTTSCPPPFLKDERRVPGRGGYRVSHAAGIGHPTGQRPGGAAVVVLVFAPIPVVFPATALELLLNKVHDVFEVQIVIVVLDSSSNVVIQKVDGLVPEDQGHHATDELNYEANPKDVHKRLEKAQVVTEGSQHANEGDDEHDDPQEDEDDGRGQKGTFKGLIFLSFHLCVDSHRQDQGSDQPEHRGVDDQRELEPEVGEARAVAHLLGVPAGHPGHSPRGSGAPGLPG